MTPVRVRIAGEGSPALVFVHGFGCALEDWDSQFAALSGRFSCIALDLPGHGGSALPDVASIAELARAVNDVRRQYVKGDAVLIGHSMGAKVIREACCQEPGGVTGLVLIDGALYQGDCRALAEAMAPRIDAMGFAAFAREHFVSMFPAGFTKGLRECMIERSAASDAVFARAIYLDAICFDAVRSLETLSAITVPILVLQSTEVRLPVGRQSLHEGDMTPLMRAVLRNNKRAVVKIVLDAGHFTMIDAPERVAAEIHAFSLNLAGDERPTYRQKR